MSGPIMVDIEGVSLTEEDRQVLQHPLTGGVILFTRNYQDNDQLADLVKELRAVKTPSLIIAVDHEGGRVQRFREHYSVIPPMRSIGKMYDADPHQACQYAEDIGWLMACELREVGVDLNFSPVVDLDYECSEVIGDRALHTDARVVSELSSALIGGMHCGGLSICAKHFPGHGAVVGDSHHVLPIDVRPRCEIDTDLEPFGQLMRQPLEAIMTAHVVVSCEDTQPVSFSRRWIHEILRQQMGFTGIIFSDDLSMRGADSEGGITQKVKRAISAGCDFLPICNDREAVLALYSSSFQHAKQQSFTSLRATRPINQGFRASNRYVQLQAMLDRLK